MVVSVFERTPRLCLPVMPWLINYFCLQEPRHLQLLADLEESNIFTVITGKKQHGAPTDFGFCIKVSLGSKRWDEAVSSRAHYEPNIMQLRVSRGGDRHEFALNI